MVRSTAPIGALGPSLVALAKAPDHRPARPLARALAQVDAGCADEYRIRRGTPGARRRVSVKRYFVFRALDLTHSHKHQEISDPYVNHLRRAR